MFCYMRCCLVHVCAVDKYNYLINGEAMSDVDAFILNQDNTEEQYIEVISTPCLNKLSPV